MVQFRTKNQVSNYLKEDGFKTFRGETKSGKSIWEDYDGNWVVVDWVNRTIEDVEVAEDGTLFHVRDM